ncbi:hypothetical protein [Enterovibrio norvegicus]|uniref:hypothetical protein n=1 Tax=Enterovibrio norvegicus TaxID=188144 RepID=UPI00352C581B
MKKLGKGYSNDLIDAAMFSYKELSNYIHETIPTIHPNIDSSQTIEWLELQCQMDADLYDQWLCANQ